MLKEIKRLRLQTLARALTEQNKLLVTFGSGFATDMTNLNVRDIDQDGCIVPGIPASRAERWVAMKAGCAHEAGHILFTDKRAWDKAVLRGPFFQNIVNILEDARIERAVANAYPGTLLWFRFANEYIVKNRTDWGTGANAFLSGLCAYAVAGVIPAPLSAKEKELIKKCAPFVDRARVAPDTWEVLRHAEEIYKLAEPAYPEVSLPPPPPMLGTDSPRPAPEGPLDPWRSKPKPEESDGKTDEGKSGSGDDEKPETGSDEAQESDALGKTDSDIESEEAGSDEPAGTGSDDPDESDPEPDEDFSEGESGHPRSDKGFSSETDHSEPEDDRSEPDEGFPVEAEESSEEEPDSPEDEAGSQEDESASSEHLELSGITEGLSDDPELEELLEGAEEELSRIESGAAREEKRKEVVPETDFGAIEEKTALGLHKGVRLEIRRPYPHPSYRELVNTQKNLIGRLADEIKKTLEFQSSVPRRSLKKGRLDPGALWKIRIPDPGVFYRVDEPGSVPDMAVYLLVDCSGSMWERVGGISRMDAAKQATALLHEACLKLGITHCVTGFTDNLGLTVRHYQAVKWNEKDGSRIASLDSEYNNRDGYSIRVAAEELKDRPEQKKLLIVLSDGLPDALDYRLREGVSIPDSALAVRQAERSGIGVIGIYFGPEEYLNFARTIYNHLVYVPTLEQLPAVLGRVLKRVTI